MKARDVVELVRTASVGVGYAMIVTMTAVILAILPGHVQQSVVLHTSTNLANLRDHPLWVLAVSAFVVSSLFGLWQLPLLVVLYGLTERWVGRAATMFVAILGHVGATLFVAVLIASGISHGYLARSIVHSPDVGFSYGLACVAGFVVSRVSRQWRMAYLAVAVVYVAGPLLISPNFTGVGHSTALILGLGLAFLASRVAAAMGGSEVGAASHNPQETGALRPEEALPAGCSGQDGLPAAGGPSSWSERAQLGQDLRILDVEPVDQLPE